MPAFSTHYIFAKELMPWLKTESKASINSDALYLGTQGPDIFFFHRILPWMIGKSLRKTGSALHRAKPELIFESMRRYAEISERKDTILSYILGFIMHYALDRVCHPYVYALQNRLTENKLIANEHTAHNVIEFAMDSYLLKKRLGIPEPHKFRTSGIINLNEADKEEIASLLRFVIKDVLIQDIGTQAVTAIDDTEYIQKITFDPHRIKNAVISAAELPLALITGGYKLSAMLKPKDLEKAQKYGNIYREMWESPYSNEERYESFEDLFERAQTEAKQMIKGFLNGADCKEITQNISFLTGVEIK